MAQEMLLRNVAPTLYVTALQSAWRAGAQIYDPSLWLYREPEIDEKMMRDADIAHCVNYRTHQVAGRTWDVLPQHENSQRGAVASMVAKDLLKCIKDFTTARRLLSLAFISGARYAEIRGELRTLTIGDGVPREWWVPTQLKDIDKRRMRLIRDDWGQKSQESDDDHVRLHWEYWSVDREDWVKLNDDRARRLVKNVYMDDEASLGHGRGLRDALGWWWYAKEHTFAESLDAVERFAQGILSAKIDGLRDAETNLPNTELVRKWTQVLEDMRARHILVYDSEDEVEVVNMNGQGWQLLSTIRQELKNTIFSLLLGAQLPTGGGSEKTGSFARAEVEENSTEALIQFDREVLEETISDDVIGYCWYMNAQNIAELGLRGEPIPRFSIAQQKREDPKERAEVAATLITAGVTLAERDVYEQTGFRRPEKGEAVIEGQKQAALPPGFGG